MSGVIFAMPGNESFAAQLGAHLRVPLGTLEARKFPDGESYIRIASSVRDCSAALVATLADPDPKVVPLILAARTLRELGARRVGLIAPYLAYMRQDYRFNEGEAVSARQFASLLSPSFDWLVTLDPHLHRIHALSEIYPIPTAIAHAAPDLAAWIGANVANPFLIGPDEESEQWVGSVAQLCRVPSTCLKKVRLGDRKVRMRWPGHDIPQGRTPVLLDDIVSSGETMLQAVRLVREKTDMAPICVAVHGLFSELADAALEDVGARLVCTNSVATRKSQIDISRAVAQSAESFLAIQGAIRQ